MAQHSTPLPILLALYPPSPLPLPPLASLYPPPSSYSPLVRLPSPRVDDVVVAAVVVFMLFCSFMNRVRHNVFVEVP